MNNVQLFDKVRCRGLKGHVCCNRATDQTCIVAYDGKPPRFSPWISWDQVELVPQPVEVKEAS